MRHRAMRAVVERDLLVVLQSRATLVPLIVVPLVIFIVLPLILGLSAPSLADSTHGVEPFLRLLPAEVMADLAHLDEGVRLAVVVLVYLLAPLNLIVPLMVASVIAADSFAGEKERGTFEALMLTPLTDGELVGAKFLSAWLPAVAVGLLGFVVYSIAVNATMWSQVGRLILPNTMWVILLVWVMPAVAGLGLGATILISARVASFQEAFQLSGVVVLPIVALVAGQAAGVIFLSVQVVVGVGLIVWLVALGLLVVGARAFARHEAIQRL